MLPRTYNEHKMSQKEEQATLLLTPSDEEQAYAILTNACPHNQGWVFVGTHAGDDMFLCTMCSEVGYA